MTVSTKPPDAETTFVAGAENRIRRWFVVLAIAGVAAGLIARQWLLSAGFALGAMVAFLSMAHLQRVVYAFTTRASGDAAEPAAATVMRFLMRFAIITLLAYAVFKVSRPAGYGYVASLFLPVAAMSCEAAYEAWFAITNHDRSS